MYGVQTTIVRLQMCVAKRALSIAWHDDKDYSSRLLTAGCVCV